MCTVLGVLYMYLKVQAAWAAAALVGASAAIRHLAASRLTVTLLEAAPGTLSSEPAASKA